MIVSAHHTLQNRLFLCLFGKEESKKYWKKLIPSFAKNTLTSFERMIPEKGFILGKKGPTCADFAIYDLITSTYPNLGNLGIDTRKYRRINRLVGDVRMMDGVRPIKGQPKHLKESVY